MVEIDLVNRCDSRIGVRVCRQQDSPRIRVEGNRLPEKLRTCHFRHALVDQ
jgi:hypothetical protein